MEMMKKCESDNRRASIKNTHSTSVSSKSRGSVMVAIDAVEQSADEPAKPTDGKRKTVLARNGTVIFKNENSTRTAPGVNGGPRQSVQRQSVQRQSVVMGN